MPLRCLHLRRGVFSLFYYVRPKHSQRQQWCYAYHPAIPTLTAGTAVNPAICGGTGSIPFTTNLANGTYTLGFSKNGNATTANVTVSSDVFTLTNQTAGVYAEFSIIVSGCTAVDNGEVELENPGCPLKAHNPVSGAWPAPGITILFPRRPAMLPFCRATR